MKHENAPVSPEKIKRKFISESEVLAIDRIMVELHQAVQDKIDLKSKRDLIDQLLALMEPFIKSTADVFLKMHKNFVSNLSLDREDLEQMLRENLLKADTYRWYESHIKHVIGFLITIFHREFIRKLIIPHSRNKRYAGTHLSESLSKHKTMDEKVFYSGQTEIEDQRALGKFKEFEDDEALRVIRDMIIRIDDPIDSLIFILHEGLGADVFLLWRSAYHKKLQEWDSGKVPKQRNVDEIDKKSFATKMWAFSPPPDFGAEIMTGSEIGQIIGGISRQGVSLRYKKVLEKLKHVLNPETEK